MAFYVGQKVTPTMEGKRLRKGEVYTVLGRAKRTARCPICGEIGLGVYLVGFPTKGAGFTPFILRPVVERKTDISIFTAMLNPSKQGVDA